ncbi:MAG TPA: hypothetical protein VK483_10630, partial [Chitinophagaceae bacterium]|nr:hypothetical protein [Chitinophagaceae bacterium]
RARKEATERNPDSYLDAAASHRTLREILKPDITERRSWARVVTRQTRGYSVHSTCILRTWSMSQLYTAHVTTRAGSYLSRLYQKLICRGIRGSYLC